MAIDYPSILDLEEKGRRYSYTDRDSMLYAIALGYGGAPLDESQLAFVHETALKTVPTLATVIAWGAGVSTARMGINQALVLHMAEETILHRPLPAAGAVIADSGVVSVYDRGEGKGALILRRTVLRSEADGAPLATLNRTILARGDGGFGDAGGAPPASHDAPNRKPDHSLSMPTLPQQAILYRLCGDRNPLHVDPQAARAAGFKAPILHGLCTYGMTCRAVLEVFCRDDPTLVASHAARFSAPVYPGESLQVDLWRDGEVVSFEASVPARDVKVIKAGKSVLRRSA